MATSSAASSVIANRSVSASADLASIPSPITAAPVLSALPYLPSATLLHAQLSGGVGQHNPQAVASMPALLAPAASKPGQTTLSPRQARESDSDDSGDPDSDSDEGQQAAYAGLGTQTSAGEDGSADSSVGERDSDADDSGSAEPAEDQHSHDAGQSSAALAAAHSGKSMAEQSKADTTDGDPDSDAAASDVATAGVPAPPVDALPPAPDNRKAPADFSGVIRIPASQIVIGSFLANGAFGKVYRGTWGDSEVALKKIDFDHARQRLELSEEEVAEALEWEVARLATTSHPNLVQFYGICHKDGAPYLVLEFCHNGSLQDALSKSAEDGSPVQASRLWQWMLEISQALAYLHEQGMLHRDLKAENVLIDQHGRARLADLGVAQVDALLAANEAGTVSQGLQEVDFTAPENVGGNRNRNSSKATDIYALGLVFWQMVTSGKLPTSWEQVHHQDPNYATIKAGYRMPIPADCPPQFSRLIRACWHVRPAERATIADVLRQLKEMAAAMHPEHVLLGFAMQLEQTLHNKRQEALHYVPCLVTLQAIEGTIEQYWQCCEQHDDPNSMRNAPQPLQLVIDDFLASKVAGTLLLLGEAGLGKSLSAHMVADSLQRQWWRHFADPAKHPKPRYLPIFIRNHVASWTYPALSNACATLLHRDGLQPGHATPLVFVDGYDECRFERDTPGNLPRYLGLPTDAKLIVTCRPRVVPEDQLRLRFAFEDKLMTCHYLPFNTGQLMGYLRQHLLWDDDTYHSYQTRLQALSEPLSALRNPFVLCMLWQSWEKLSARPLEQLTRRSIYECFVEHVVDSLQDVLDEKVRQQLHDGHGSLAASFQAYAQETALLAAEGRSDWLPLDQAYRTGSAWASLNALVQQQALQRFKQNQAKLERLSAEEQKERKRRIVLTKDDYTRIQQQKVTQLVAKLPLRPRASALEFIHKSVFEYFLTQRLARLPDKDDEGITEDALREILNGITASSPDVLMGLRVQLEAREKTSALNEGTTTTRQQRLNARLLYSIATVLFDRQLYAEALSYFYKTLAIQEKALGADHADTATSYDKIGASLTMQGDFMQAIKHCYKALDIREKVLGIHHADTADSYDRMGALARSSITLDADFQFVSPMVFFRKALAVREKIFGDGHVAIATSYNNIATQLKAEGCFNEALTYYRKALDIFENVCGINDTRTATAYNNIGVVLKAQGQHDLALAFYYKALAVIEKTFGTDHTSTGVCYSNIRALLQGERNYRQAVEFYLKEIAIHEKVFGPDNAINVRSHLNVGSLLEEQGMLEQAMKYYRRAAALWERQSNARHSDGAVIYNNIGVLLLRLNGPEEAIEYFGKELAIWKARPGTLLKIANCYSNIGASMKAQRKYEQALDFYQKALTGTLESLGDKHSALTSFHYDVGDMLEVLGKPGEALFHFQQAWKIAAAHGLPGAATCQQRSEALSQRMEAGNVCIVS